MDKFIYVFSEDDRDYLLKNGYDLIPCNTNTGMYVFVNRRDMMFCLDGIKAVTSNVLSL